MSNEMSPMPAGMQATLNKMQELATSEKPAASEGGRKRRRSKKAKGKKRKSSKRGKSRKIGKKSRKRRR
tara:strand:+ start:95 stop:301 length:207 start_codon:yes stop_codon:yes gene_type:complete